LLLGACSPGARAVARDAEKQARRARCALRVAARNV
jgi:hypothetical protein